MLAPSDSFTRGRRGSTIAPPPAPALKLTIGTVARLIELKES
jgi:hypothetical protein